jgi:hypothetical protein
MQFKARNAVYSENKRETHKYIPWTKFKFFYVLAYSSYV